MLASAHSDAAFREKLEQRLKGLEAAGVDNLAIQTVEGSARELIEEFSTQIIAKM